MIQIKYDVSMIKYFSLFESVTHVPAKDCFPVNETIIFFVNSGKAKIAVGKQGMNIKKLSSMINKDVRVVEFSKDIVGLVRNVVFPLKPKSVEIVNNEDKNRIINIEFKSPKERRVLLDNNQKKLKLLKDVVNRYHKDINDIRILQI
ncbi:MAG: NusA-like transcription termination signal-binding factor [Candidatus Woesearchaeota archaeon]|nr:MAG: NusA-like transcription termination signal-binding factor [Candidatus Woesearchaeota archaeon]